jgi:hypothetical protein
LFPGGSRMGPDVYGRDVLDQRIFGQSALMPYEWPPPSTLSDRQQFVPRGRPSFEDRASLALPRLIEVIPYQVVSDEPRRFFPSSDLPFVGTGFLTFSKEPCRPHGPHSSEAQSKEVCACLALVRIELRRQAYRLSPRGRYLAGNPQATPTPGIAGTK